VVRVPQIGQIAALSAMSFPQRSQIIIKTLYCR
jgi:hypothetical protein